MAPKNQAKPKTLAEQLAALPALTDHAPYRELIDRDQALAKDREQVKQERAAVLAEMARLPGGKDLKATDIEAMKLAGLDAPEMGNRAELAEKLEATDKRVAELTRARELLVPHIERARAEAKVLLGDTARPVYREAVRAAAESYFACCRKMVEFLAARKHLERAGLLGGAGFEMPIPAEGANSVLACGGGLYGTGPKGMINRLLKTGFLTEEEGAALYAEFREIR